MRSPIIKIFPEFVKIRFSYALAEKLKTKRCLINCMDADIIMNSESYFEPPCFIHSSFFAWHPLQIGAYSGIVGGSTRNTSIGRYCSIAPYSTLGLSEHPTNRLTTSWVSYVDNPHDWRTLSGIPRSDSFNADDSDVQDEPIIIGNDVWIGAHVYIRGGVKIGNGAIIAAGSVVVKDVEPYAIVGGVPAKVIRYRFPEKIIERIEQTKWWEYNVYAIRGLRFNSIENSIEDIEKYISEGPEKFTPERIYAKDLARIAEELR